MRSEGLAFAEDGGTDADGGGAFFYGYGEVAGHAHGEFFEVGVTGGVVVAEFAEMAEEGACGFAFGGERRDGHETRDAQVLQGMDRVQEIAESFRGDAMLGFLVGQFDFDEDRENFPEVGCCGVEAFGGFEGVDGVDGGEEFRGLGCFVVLQRADEVDFEIRQCGKGGSFGLHFLNAVFAEEALTGVVGFDESGYGMGLADGHEADVVRGSARVGGGGCELFADSLQIVSNTHPFSVRGGCG